jgi:membrane protease YdiL (CAAX protease family)
MTDTPDQVPPPKPPKVHSESLRGVLSEESISSSVLTHLLGWIAAFSVGGLMLSLVLIGSHLATPEAGGLQRIQMEQEMTGQMIYAAGPSGMNVDSSLLVPQISQLKDGSLVSRLSYAVLTSEVNTPAAGIEELDSIHEEKAAGTLELSPEEQTLLDDVSVLLFAVASGERADELPEEREESLRSTLGFFGELLVAKSSGDQSTLDDLGASSIRSMVALLITAIWFISFFLGGIAALVILGIFAGIGKLKLKFSLAGSTGSVYMETFAIWIGMFFLLQIIMEGLTGLLLGGKLAIYIGPEFGLISSLIVMFVSLTALVWPRIRGISSATLLDDIGLGRVNVFKEILPGFVTYAMGLPLLVVGLMLSIVVAFVLNALFGEQPAASHPIQGLIGEGGWMTIVLVYLVACVAAPITEEIMFRGVLYRYLREFSRAYGLILSIIFSMLISSFLFAAIHPQGLSFIPVLGALAVAFCIGREWRGSLVAPMVAHGLSNGVVMTLNVVLFS